MAIAGWIWLITGVFRSGGRHLPAILAFQLSVVAFAYGLLRGGLSSALMLAVFPPQLLIHIHHAVDFTAFLAKPFSAAVLAGLITFALCLLVRSLRWWSVAPVALAGLVTLVIMGERVSQQAMCRAAAALEITGFTRNTFLWSLANVPVEFQLDIHALLVKGEKRYGWSYREMGWYEIPNWAGGGANGAMHSCQ